MPRKYIHLKQLYARSPFPSPHIHFLLRKRERTTTTHTEIELGRMTISHQPNEFIDLIYSPSQTDELGLYVVAVSADDRVANLGYVPLNLGEKVEEVKVYLQGVQNQNGFVIYSTRDTPFKEKNKSTIIGQLTPGEDSLFESKQKSAAEQQSFLYQESANKVQSQAKIGKNQKEDDNPPKINAFNSNSKHFSAIEGVSEPGFKFQDSGVKSVVLPNKKEGKGRLGVSRWASSSIRDVGILRDLTSSFVSHKAKNANYLKQLGNLSLQYKKQQQKLKQLGIISEH